MVYNVFIPKEIGNKLSSLGIFEDFKDLINTPNKREFENAIKNGLKNYLSDYEISIFKAMNRHIIDMPMDEGIPSLSSFMNINYSIDSEEKEAIADKDINKNTSYMSDRVDITSYFNSFSNLHVLDTKISKVKPEEFEATVFYITLENNNNEAFQSLLRLWELL